MECAPDFPLANPGLPAHQLLQLIARAYDGATGETAVLARLPAAAVPPVHEAAFAAGLGAVRHPVRSARMAGGTVHVLAAPPLPRPSEERVAVRQQDCAEALQRYQWHCARLEELVSDVRAKDAQLLSEELARRCVVRTVCRPPHSHRTSCPGDRAQPAS